MTESDLDKQTSLRVLHGEGLLCLCIWERGVVRSSREARALAAHGCDATWSAGPSHSMRGFLSAYSAQLEEQLGPAPFHRERICIEGVSSDNRVLLGEALALAREFGLSYLDAHGVVNVRLAADDVVSTSALLRLLESGAMSRASLATDLVRVVLRYSGDRFVATVWHASRVQGLALRLLGFQRTRRGWWQQQLEPSPYASARALIRVLHACSCDGAEIDTALLPPDPLLTVTRMDAVSPQHRSAPSQSADASE